MTMSVQSWAKSVMEKDMLPVVLVMPPGLVLVPLKLTGPFKQAAVAAPLFRGYVAAAACRHCAGMLDV